jgi:hypothetical protein
MVSASEDLCWAHRANSKAGEGLVMAVARDKSESKRSAEPLLEKEAGVNPTGSAISLGIIDSIITSVATRRAVSGKPPKYAEQLLDLVMAPQDSESTLANLEEAYLRRAQRNRKHAWRWYWFQVLRIAFYETMKLIRTFNAARAGK